MATDPQDIVDALDALILANLAGGGPMEYSMGGNRVVFRTFADLQRTRDYYKEQVDAASRGGSTVLGGLSNAI